MAQDAIVIYENGHPVGGEGHPTYARDITFENEGTDLEAEKVQAAIKEVNDKTKHGTVELWKNTSPTSAMAGQTISFSNKGYDLDAVELQLGYISGGTEYRVTNSVKCEIGGKAEPTYIALNGQSRTTAAYRNFSVSESGGTISITISDCTTYTQQSIGTAPTTATTNTVLVLNRVLGLIHND